MKRAGRKIVGVVAWDYQIAQIADRAGVDLVSVGDSVGVNLWGQAPDEITIEEMLTVCRAVRRGVQRAVVSVDLPAHEQNVDAALLDFRHSGPVAGAAVSRAVKIPVIGGLGGGPWLDGRMRMAHAAIGYGFSSLESKTDQYANVARITLEALSEYAGDVRAGRPIRGQR